MSGPTALFFHSDNPQISVDINDDEQFPDGIKLLAVHTMNATEGNEK